jgi:hypothetical protein
MKGDPEANGDIEAFRGRQQVLKIFLRAIRVRLS